MVGLLTGLALAAPACKDKGAGKDKGGTARPARTADAAPATPAPEPAPEHRYPDSLAGLQQLMMDLRDAIVADDQDRMAFLLDGLRLRQPRRWFGAIFESRLGRDLAREYEPLAQEIGLLADVLRNQFRAGLTEINVESFATPNVPGATGYQHEALSRMVKRTTLYSVRLSTPSGSAVFHLWSFVHQDETFRYVGKMRGVSTEPPPKQGRDIKEFRLADAERVRRSSP